MIKVVANLQIKKECIDEAIRLYDEFIDITRAEQGNISYELFQDNEDPCSFYFIEEWERQEDCDRHLNAPHFLAILPKEQEMQQENTKLNIRVLNKIK